MPRPAGDLSVTGWTASAGGSLFAQVDEDVADDGDFITSPSLTVAPQEATFSLDAPVPAGQHRLRFRAAATAAEMRVTLQTSAGQTTAQSAWQPLSGTPTTYLFDLTSMMVADRVTVAVRSTTGAPLMLDSNAIFLGSDPLYP